MWCVCMCFCMCVCMVLYAAMYMYVYSTFVCYVCVLVCYILYVCEISNNFFLTELLYPSPISTSTKPSSDSSIKSNSSVSSRIRSNFASKKLHIISEDTIMEEINNSLLTPGSAEAMSKDMVMAFNATNDTQLQEKMDDIESNSKWV